MSAARVTVRWVLAAGVTLAATFGLARASGTALAYHENDGARLRLSWSARPERIEVCRTLSAEELAQREEHMRQRVECDGRFATYALRVETDGRLVGEAIVRGAGFRHDRPLFLLREFDLPAGAHRVRVAFTRRERTDGDAAAFAPVVPAGTDTGIFAGRAQREATERARRARAAIPPQLLLDTALVLPSHGVVLVTFDQEQRVLRLVSSGAE